MNVAFSLESPNLSNRFMMDLSKAQQHQVVCFQSENYQNYLKSDMDNVSSLIFVLHCPTQIL